MSAIRRSKAARHAGASQRDIAENHQDENGQPGGGIHKAQSLHPDQSDISFLSDELSQQSRELIDLLRTVEKRVRRIASQASVLEADSRSTNQGPKSTNGSQSRRQLLAQLTPAERRVLVGIVDAGSVKCLAHQLRLSPRTVHNQLASIRRKLSVSTRLELTILYLRSAE